MAPSETLSASQDKPISTIVIIIAMQTEALPLVNSLQLVEDKNPVVPQGVPWVRYVSSYKDLQINLIWPGKDSLFAVTYIVDGDKPTPEEFLQNLVSVTAALDRTVIKVVDFISGKCLSEL